MSKEKICPICKTGEVSFSGGVIGKDAFNVNCKICGKFVSV
jgi:hypothetical protein